MIVSEIDTFKFGGNTVDALYQGDSLVWPTGPVFKLLDITVTSPTQVSFSAINGLTENRIQVDDNGDGTWHAWSSDVIDFIRFNGNKADVTEVVINSHSPLTSTHQMFSSMTNLVSLDITALDTTGVQDFSSMFSELRSLLVLDVSNLNTSSATSFNNAFSGSTMSTLDLSSWSTSNVTNMSYMFANNGAYGGIVGIQHIDMTGWVFGQGPTTVDMMAMFRDAQGIVCLSNIDITNNSGYSNIFLRTGADNPSGGPDAPTTAEMTSITQGGDTLWTNPNSCPQ